MNMIERNLYLGIDPGQSGGMAILTSEGEIVDVSKMPETETDVSEYIREFSKTICMAVIEGVHAMPKQGVSSSFKFGRQYGGLRMALIAHQIRFETVMPGVWQKSMSCLSQGRNGPTDGKTEKKNLTKSKAQELFPVLPDGSRITHAIADALLLAEFARRRFRN